MTIMTLLLAGTIGIIYFSSYKEMSDRDAKMLDHYVSIHDRSQLQEDKQKQNVKEDDKQKQTAKNENQQLGDKKDSKELAPPKPEDQENKNHNESMPPKPENERAYDVASIYSVLLDNNKVVSIDNNSETLTDKKLTSMARKIVKNGEKSGKINGYGYKVKTNKDQQVLVAFIDQSDFDQSISTLMKYTLIFGIVALIIVFVISIFLANLIIKPLENNHNMQKRFISDAGHELKTPVTVISTNAEVLAEEIGDNRWLNNIVYENDRMALLIKELMDLTKTDQVKIKFDRVDLSRLVVGEILPFEGVAYDKGMEINYDSVEDSISVNGDSAKLGHLVSILVDNAVEHSSGKNIEVKLNKTHKKAVLQVINDGKVIPEEKRKHLFDRFYRIDESRNFKGNHYGLGLSIAKSIVDMHKGEISVDCKDGKVIFKVALKVG